jgi:hypothetical protein
VSALPSSAAAAPQPTRREPSQQAISQSPPPQAKNPVDALVRVYMLRCLRATGLRVDGCTADVAVIGGTFLLDGYVVGVAREGSANLVFCAGALTEAAFLVEPCSNLFHAGLCRSHHVQDRSLVSPFSFPARELATRRQDVLDTKLISGS